MQRRTLLKLGGASAALLLVAGGGAALLRPGLEGGKLAAGARDVFAALGAAILDGSLPPAPARTPVLQGLLARIDGVVAALPPHAQAELSQLLGLLQTAPGRKTLAGLDVPWAEASIPDTQAALQSMRVSRLALRRQSYQALHDIVGGAYFAEPATWSVLGYPGPRTV